MSCWGKVYGLNKFIISSMAAQRNHSNPKAPAVSRVIGCTKGSKYNFWQLCCYLCSIKQKSSQYSLGKIQHSLSQWNSQKNQSVIYFAVAMVDAIALKHWIHPGCMLGTRATMIWPLLLLPSCDASMRSLSVARHYCHLTHTGRRLQPIRWWVKVNVWDLW